MRKNNLGNKIVKKAITWAMVAMMTLSGSLSSFASMNVHAEETVVENEDGSVTTTETTTETTNTTNADGSTVKTETTTETTTTAPETTTTTATTTQPTTTNIASDEDLCTWAANDYNTKTGNTAYKAEITSKSDVYEITLTDSEGKVLDVYSIDPATGVGSAASGEEVNLPQTGTLSLNNLFMVLGAFALTVCGFFAVMASGMFRRKTNEE